MILEDLKDGDIVECFIFNNGENQWFDYKDGVFDKSNQSLILTRGCIFDFNNHDLIDVRFEFELIGNVHEEYNYHQTETTLQELLDYLMINHKLNDLEYRVDGSSVDIGYFEYAPVNVVEIRDNKVNKVGFSRGQCANGLNQNKFNWLYYLKDKSVLVLY